MIHELLASDLSWRLGWMLLHSLWQVLLVGVLVGLLMPLLSRKSAKLRYCIACGGLAFVYIPLAITFILVPSRPAEEPLIASGSVSWAPNATVAADTMPPVTDVAATTYEPVAFVGSPVAATEAGAPEAVEDGGRATGLVPVVSPWLPWVVGLWFAGVGLLGCWNLCGWIVVQRLRSCGTASVAETIRERLTKLARRMRITAPVQLVESALVDVPMVIGWLKPVILLPASLLTNLPPSQLDAILAHELAHVRRHDYLVNLLQSLTETLLFFHPVVWLLSKRIRIEREFCCDDAAIAACGDQAAYVRALATVESRRFTPSCAVALSDKPGLTLDRIRRIKGISPGARRGWAGACCAILLIAALGFGVACSQSNSDGDVTAGEQVVDEADRVDTSVTLQLEPEMRVIDGIETPRVRFAPGEDVMLFLTITNQTVEDLQAPEIWWSAHVVVDGLGYELLPQYGEAWRGPGTIGADGGQFRGGVSLLHYGVTGEQLTPGEHAILVRIGDVESNAVTISVGDAESGDTDAGSSEELERLDPAHFRLDLTYEGASDKPFYNVTLCSYPLDERSGQDGRIVSVDNRTRTVWINLGHLDNLRTQATLSVYTNNDRGIGRDVEDIKAKIEVTRVLGPHMAEARIVEEDLRRPIVEDDPIYSPLWSPGPFSLIEPISAEEAAMLITFLNESRFFQHAQSDAGPFLVPERDQRYWMRVESGDREWREDLGWDLGLLLRLEGLQRVLDDSDDETPTPLDLLLGRLTGYRQIWTEGRVVDDLKSQISSGQTTFVAGEPIPITLDITNVGEQERQYASHSVSRNGIEIKVFDQYGRPVPHVGGTTQVRRQISNVAPGQTAVIESFDLAEFNYLRKPGTYTVVYVGQEERRSNRFRFEVTPGPAGNGDLVGRLLPLVHDKWMLVANPNFTGSIGLGSNFEDADGFPVGFENHPTGSISDISFVWLWFTEEQAVPRDIDPRSSKPAVQYLGQVDRWHLYALADEESLREWPTVFDEVRRAVGLREDAISRLVDELNRTPDWTNGIYSLYGLAEAATMESGTTEEVLALATRNNGFGDRISDIQVIERREVKFHLEGDMTAIWFDSNLGEKILLMHNRGHWWTRIYDVAEAQDQTESPAFDEPTVRTQVAAANLVVVCEILDDPIRLAERPVLPGGGDYECIVRIEEVLKGEPGMAGETIPVSLSRGGEREYGLSVEQGATGITCLERHDEGETAQFFSTDIWPDSPELRTLIDEIVVVDSLSGLYPASDVVISGRIATDAAGVQEESGAISHHFELEPGTVLK